MSNLMPPKINPLSFHGRAKAEWQKKQAIWFKSCSISHMLFCNCGDWMLHLQRYHQRQQCRGTEDIGGAPEGISFVTEDGGSLGGSGGERGGDDTRDVG
ncbi:ORF2 [Pitorquevirus ursid11]|uniref:ORF2 n=1 Tax=Giant panda anellovirus TaxID=2016460 RepID=A0A220IGK8_9VIRU|nr:ORF2 [Giant panda anellovirus]ASH99107.1 ORF2 [Giant panda anellovirus]